MKIEIRNADRCSLKSVKSGLILFVYERKYDNPIKSNIPDEMAT